MDKGGLKKRYKEERRLAARLAALKLPIGFSSVAPPTEATGRRRSVRPAASSYAVSLPTHRLTKSAGLKMPKRGNGIAECEDVGSAREGRFVVSDGASEGAFSGVWAEKLAEAFLAAPDPDSLTLGWISEASDRFSNFIHAKNVPWHGLARLERGTFATIAAAWLAPDGRSLRVLTIGDSCIAVFSEDRRIDEFVPISDPKEFANNPWLISNQAEYNRKLPAEKILRRQFDVAKGTQVLLMTDALAKWYLEERLMGRYPAKTLSRLVERRKQFATFIEKLRDAGRMRNDDVTLLVVRVR